MTPFIRLSGLVAPLLRDNVDTEIIIPIGRLVAFKRGQLGPYAFEPWRYDASGAPRADFPLNQPRHHGAAILIAGANFGCGSSREAAVWALWDLGIRCIIAPSFGDIFRMNCYQNGLLPIALPGETVTTLAQELATASSPRAEIDLRSLTLRTPSGCLLPFSVPAERRVALLEGLDEVQLTLRQLDDIRAFESRDEAERPWVYRLPQ